MQRKGTFREQQFTERRSQGAKGDGLETRAVTGGNGAAHMVGARRIGIEHPMGGKDKQRRRVRLPVRPCLFQQFDQVEGGTRGRQGAVNKQDPVAGSGNGVMQFGIEKKAQRLQVLDPDGKPRRHGVAAALLDQAHVQGLAHRAAEINAADGAAGTRGHARRPVECQGEGGKRKGFLEACCRKANDTWMPGVGGHDDCCALAFLAKACLGLRLGILDGAHFQRLALAVHLVELSRHVDRFATVIAKKQIERLHGMADPARRIEARPDHVTQRIGIRLPLETRDIGECGYPGIFPPRHDLEALRDKSPVQALERNHVADRGKGHQLKPTQKVGFFALGVEELPCAQRPVGRGGKQQGEAGSTQVPQPRGIVLAVRIDDGKSLWQFLRRLMMVNDDALKPLACGVGQRIMGQHATVEGHEQARSPGAQGLHCGNARPVSFGNAVGDVDFRRTAECRKVALEQGRGTDTIHVIVADDADLFAGDDGFGKTGRALLEVAQRRWLGHQAA